MADETTKNITIIPKLDPDGLRQVWSLITAGFLAKGAADLNVIESVKVNGVTLEITDKGVDIKVPTGTLASLDKVDAGHLEDALLELITGKADKAATLAGYGIADAYTKDETAEQIQAAVKQAITGVYVAKGSIAFSNLPTENVETGWVYNVKEEFTTTDAFVEGTGNTYPAGTNVVWTADGWDCMAGIWDFGAFVMRDEIQSIPPELIDEICVLPTV